MRLTNWAGNVAFRAQRLHRPTSLQELQEVVAAAAAAGVAMYLTGTRHFAH